MPDFSYKLYSNYINGTTKSTRATSRPRCEQVRCYYFLGEIVLFHENWKINLTVRRHNTCGL